MLRLQGSFSQDVANTIEMLTPKRFATPARSSLSTQSHQLTATIDRQCLKQAPFCLLEKKLPTVGVGLATWNDCTGLLQARNMWYSLLITVVVMNMSMPYFLMVGVHSGSRYAFTALLLKAKSPPIGCLFKQCTERAYAVLVPTMCPKQQNHHMQTITVISN